MYSQWVLHNYQIEEATKCAVKCKLHPQNNIQASFLQAQRRSSCRKPVVNSIHLRASAGTTAAIAAAAAVILKHSSNTNYMYTDSFIACALVTWRRAQVAYTYYTDSLIACAFVTWRRRYCFDENRLSQTWHSNFGASPMPCAVAKCRRRYDFE